MMTVFIRSTFTVLIFTLVACGGGGGSDSTNPTPTPDPTFSLDGFLSKAPVNNASCEAFEINTSGSRGSSLGTGSTANGSVSFGTAITYQGNALLNCSGGSYTDESTGISLTAPTLRAVVSFSGNSTFTISPLTELAVQVAGANLNSVDNAAVASAFGLIGVDITTVTPDDLNTVITDNDDAGQYGTLLATISQMHASAGGDLSTLLSGLAIDFGDGAFSNENLSAIGTATQALASSAVASNLNATVISELVSTAGLIVGPSLIPDAIPDNVVIPPLEGVEPNTQVQSSPIVILGINVPVDFTIDGGEYSIDGSSFSSDRGSIENGQTVVVRTSSPAGFAQESLVTIDIGGSAFDFRVTTRNADITPDLIEFTTVNNAALGQIQTSNSLTISGIEAPVSISINGGTYSINNQPFSAETANLFSGDQLTLRTTSADRPGVIVNVVVTISGEESIFSVATAPDTQAPIANIIFPKGLAMIEREEVTIRGSASDNTGVLGIKVNGVDAVTNNGFVEWTATVPLAVGMNELVVQVTDLAGLVNTQPVSAHVQRQAFFTSLDVMTDITGSGVVYVGSATFDNIFSIDVTSGLRRLISTQDNGLGDFPLDFKSITVDSREEFLYLLDFRGEAVWRINISTGDRQVLSDDINGAGLNINAPSGISIGPNDGKVYVVDWNAGTGGVIFEIDRVTGDRVVISGNGIGTGPAFDVAQQMVYDDRDEVFYVADSGLDAIIEVDIDSGNRRIVSSDSVGDGDNINSPNSLALDKNENVLYTDTNYFALGRSTARAIVSIDLESGDKTVVSGENAAFEQVGDGESVGFVQALALNDQTGSLVYAGTGPLLGIDLNNGDRVILSQPSGEYGRQWEFPLAIEKLSDRLIIGDSQHKAFFQYDLESGAVSEYLRPDDAGLSVPNSYDSFTIDEAQQTLFNLSSLLFGENVIRAYNIADGTFTKVTGDGLGSGDPIVFRQDIGIDKNNSRLLVSDSFSQNIFTVDIETGDRALLTGVSSGNGAATRRPHYFDIDSENQRIFVCDIQVDSIYSADLNNGFRSLISDFFKGVGSGERMESPHYCIFDTDTDQIVALSTNPSTLLSIDVASGDRTVLIPSESFNDIPVSDMTYLFDENIAFFVNGRGGQLIALDTVTLESVMLF